MTAGGKCFIRVGLAQGYESCVQPKEFVRASAVACRQCRTYLPERLTRGENSRRRWSLVEELIVAGSALAASIAMLLGLTEASLLGEVLFSPIIRCNETVMAQAGRLLASSGGRRHCAQLQCCKAHTSGRQEQLSLPQVAHDATSVYIVLFDRCHHRAGSSVG